MLELKLTSAQHIRNIILPSYEVYDLFLMSFLKESYRHLYITGAEKSNAPNYSQIQQLSLKLGLSLESHLKALLTCLALKAAELVSDCAALGLG